MSEKEAEVSADVGQEAVPVIGVVVGPPGVAPASVVVVECQGVLPAPLDARLRNGGLDKVLYFGTNVRLHDECVFA